jgi:putative flippase GtrA
MKQHIIDLYSGVEARYPRILKWVRFFVSGGTGAAVNIGLLFVLTHIAHLWYLFSSILAFMISVCVSFVMQKYWTFQNKETHVMHVQAGWFALLALFNLGLNTLLMYACVEGVGLHYIAAQIVTSLLIAIESYFIYKVIFARTGN